MKHPYQGAVRKLWRYKNFDRGLLTLPFLIWTYSWNQLLESSRSNSFVYFNVNSHTTTSNMFSNSSLHCFQIVAFTVLICRVLDDGLHLVEVIWNFWSTPVLIICWESCKYYVHNKLTIKKSCIDAWKVKQKSNWSSWKMIGYSFLVKSSNVYLDSSTYLKDSIKNLKGE